MHSFRDLQKLEHPIFHLFEQKSARLKKPDKIIFEKNQLYLITAPFLKNPQCPVPYRRPLPVPYRHSLPVPYNGPL